VEVPYWRRSVDWKIDKTLGYEYAISKDHYLANSQGKVYKHIFVMCEHIGRPLRHDECVHHKDRNRSNNDLRNLQLLTKSEHALLHAIEDRGFKAERRENRECEHCKKPFTCSENSEQIFCSSICAAEVRRKFEISGEDLLVMVWTMPTTEVAKTLGVSDVAVSKRCRKLHIPKPPRGYWAKVKAGIITPSIPPYLNK